MKLSRPYKLNTLVRKTLEWKRVHTSTPLTAERSDLREFRARVAAQVLREHRVLVSRRVRILQMMSQPEGATMEQLLLVFGCASKTITRDIDWLRHEVSFVISHDVATKAYFLCRKAGSA